MARRKPRRPSPDRESRRTEIIAAAVRLCARLGMENLTFGAIAKETSLSRPLIYFYFPDLASLLLEALRVGSNDLHQRFLSAVHADATGLDQIRSLGRAYVNFAREQPEMFELLAHNESKQPQGLHEHPAMQQCMQNQESILGLLVAASRKAGGTAAFGVTLATPSRWPYASGARPTGSSSWPPPSRKICRSSSDRPTPTSPSSAST